MQFGIRYVLCTRVRLNLSPQIKGTHMCTPPHWSLVFLRHISPLSTVQLRKISRAFGLLGRGLGVLGTASFALVLVVSRLLRHDSTASLSERE